MIRTYVSIIINGEVQLFPAAIVERAVTLEVVETDGPDGDRTQRSLGTYFLAVVDGTLQVLPHKR